MIIGLFGCDLSLEIKVLSAMRDSESLDPWRGWELPIAVFNLSITAFVILWKTAGVAWMPFGLGTRFQEIFTNGYYARDMTRHESEYNLLYLLMYGVLGTLAQLASIRIAQIRRQPNNNPGVLRHIFFVFHLAMAVYHLLFVFQIVKGKMLMEQLAPWQMQVTKVMYCLVFVMVLELVFGGQRFFRRKVCLDIVSACNLVPFLLFWFFAITGFSNQLVNEYVGYAFFTIIPIVVLLTEWGSWMLSSERMPRTGTPPA